MLSDICICRALPMVLLTIPRPLIVGDEYSPCPNRGKSLKARFCDTLLIGMSKLGVFVTLKMSKVNLEFTRSVIRVCFTTETSPRFCQDCRKMLRCPVVKLVS